MNFIYKSEARKHYKKALYISKLWGDRIPTIEDAAERKSQSEINSIQLGLGLNYSVFLYEIDGMQDSKKAALRHLKRLLERALEEFDHWKESETEKISQ